MNCIPCPGERRRVSLEKLFVLLPESGKADSGTGEGNCGDPHHPDSNLYPVWPTSSSTVPIRPFTVLFYLRIGHPADPREGFWSSHDRVQTTYGFDFAAKNDPDILM